MALVAGCGGGVAHHAAAPKPPVRRLAAVHPAKLIVTVVDGNRSTRVRGATVRLWRRAAPTNRKGEAVIRVPDRKSMYVTVQARGYAGRTLFEPFARFRRVTVRIYRPKAAASDAKLPILVFFHGVVSRARSAPPHAPRRYRGMMQRKPIAEVHAEGAQARLIAKLPAIGPLSK